MNETLFALKDFYGMRLLYRRETTDEKVIAEVLGNRIYLKQKIEIEAGETWLDLGANIGTFSCLSASLKAKVIAVEPEPENFSIMEKNFEENGFKVKTINAAVLQTAKKNQRLFLCKGGYNKYRHTVTPIKGREAIIVATVGFDELLKKYKPQGIKLDIEGEELKIFEAEHDWAGVKKMALEYHFDFDRSVENFYRRMARLETQGFKMIYTAIPKRLKSYNFYPAAKIVYGIRE